MSDVSKQMLAAALLRAPTEMMVYDRPQIVAGAPPTLDERGRQPLRDFFTVLPAGGDLYLPP
ncbi:hypothetical protein FHS23_004170 [Prauserella isguenensis]|uniref:Uncharacterized protein n=1 Tax=Prauserella isguenensis TaxID=1470180 RepID=A0A839S923_9PSEU|nr:hypothetical protein [Prauserella isguenensis]MBB3053127.1 hypothetical protein [Prauserella isguenensis]